ncbi:MAG: universal stress protein [Candidatus Promineifilaceae bacterium]
MTDSKEHELAIQRILVALDASTHSLAALEAAAKLASSLHAELIGIFVEDENLLHLAGLPFSHELQSPTAKRTPMDSDVMEHQLHLQAAQARWALENAAQKAEVSWSFQTIRGQVTPSVLSAALSADLVALGRVSRPLHARRRLGSTARAASEMERSVLIMQQGSSLTYPVLVTYDGSAAAQQALTAAAKLARLSGDKLDVLLITDEYEQAKPLRDEIVTWLEEHDLTAEFRWLPETSVEKLAEMVQSRKECILVLGGDNPLLEAGAIQDLLDKTDCPVLLVR